MKFNSHYFYLHPVQMIAWLGNMFLIHYKPITDVIPKNKVDFGGHFFKDNMIKTHIRIFSESVRIYSEFV